MSDATLIVKYKYFRSMIETWDALFDEAAEFAARIGRERLISISQSESTTGGVVTVWYWAEPDSIDA
jgi:hypothetical protein